MAVEFPHRQGQPGKEGLDPSLIREFEEQREVRAMGRRRLGLYNELDRITTSETALRYMSNRYGFNEPVGIIVPIPTKEDLSKNSGNFLAVLQHEGVSQIGVIGPTETFRNAGKGIVSLEPSTQAIVLDVENPVKYFTPKIIGFGAEFILTDEGADNDVGKARELDEYITRALAGVNYRKIESSIDPRIEDELLEGITDIELDLHTLTQMFEGVTVHDVFVQRTDKHRPDTAA